MRSFRDYWNSIKRKDLVNEPAGFLVGKGAHMRWRAFGPFQKRVLGGRPDNAGEARRKLIQARDEASRDHVADVLPVLFNPVSFHLVARPSPLSASQAYGGRHLRRQANHLPHA
ncbi:MAG: hypothetical protein CMN87_15455 [Stappia sp.]|nr:hypothetical protein [Stappia sp.]MBM21401.1 hypothetical protein [Stappia sp.]